MPRNLLDLALLARTYDAEAQLRRLPVVQIAWTIEQGLR
jgi:hypothetical protein